MVDQPDLFTVGDQMYLLCDDYGPEVVHWASNKRAEQFLLKQYLAVAAVDGSAIRLDMALRHDFAGATPRLYRWRPMSGFGMEHLTIEGRNDIVDTEETNIVRVLKRSDRENRLVGNWHVEPRVDLGTGTIIEDNRSVPLGWDDFPFVAFCGHEHQMMTETA